jgi:hypothetical protein
MSNVPSDKQYIQIENTYALKPVSEELIQTLGGSLNYLLDTGEWTFDVFTANGTWVCPSRVTKIFAYGCGGGGAGGSGVTKILSGGGGPDEYFYYCGGGGSGSVPLLTPVFVTPSTSYAVTIGSGGTSASQNGGSTLFGSLLTIPGGGGGYSGSSLSAPDNTYQFISTLSYKYAYNNSKGGMGYFATNLGVYSVGNAQKGENFTQYTGGAVGSEGGGGGGAALGNGGNGATGSANATAGSGYGSGGGGGYYTVFTHGAGANGILYLIYQKDI